MHLVLPSLRPLWICAALLAAILVAQSAGPAHKHPGVAEAVGPSAPNQMALDADAATPGIETTRVVTGAAPFTVGINVAQLGPTPYAGYQWEFEFPKAGLAFDDTVVENTSATGIGATGLGASCVNYYVGTVPGVVDATNDVLAAGACAGGLIGTDPVTGNNVTATSTFVGQTTTFSLHCLADGTFTIRLLDLSQHFFGTSLIASGGTPLDTGTTGVTITCTNTGAATRHRYVVFLGGISSHLGTTEIDRLKGPCGDPANDPTFGNVKALLVTRGFVCSDFLQYSYEGGSVTHAGSWIPNPYSCASTGRPLSPFIADSSAARLHDMLRAFQGSHQDAVFTLVGHSQGGLIGFMELEGMKSNALTPAAPIDTVVTADSPLGGVPLTVWDAGARLVFNFVLGCPFSPSLLFDSAAVLEIGNRANANTRLLNEQTVTWALSKGANVATLGNWDDCLYSLAHCLSAQDFFGESFPASAITQIVGNAKLDGVGVGSNRMYDLCSRRIAILCWNPFLGLNTHSDVLHLKAQQIAALIGVQN